MPYLNCLSAFFLVCTFCACLSEAQKKSEECSCNLEAVYDSISVRDTSTKGINKGLSTDIQLKGDINKKVGAEFKLSGSLSDVNLVMKTVYKEIRSSNPHITQLAAIYRGIAVAMCETICQNPSLDAKAKSDYKMQILNDYLENVKSIEGVLKTVSEPPTPQPPVKKGPVESTRQHMPADTVDADAMPFEVKKHI
jgi:hypothetical protein